MGVKERGDGMEYFVFLIILVIVANMVGSVVRRLQEPFRTSGSMSSRPGFEPGPAAAKRATPVGLRSSVGIPLPRYVPDETELQELKHRGLEGIGDEHRRTLRSPRVIDKSQETEKKSEIPPELSAPVPSQTRQDTRFTGSLLFKSSDLVKGVIFSEILGPPRSRSSFHSRKRDPFKR